MGNTRSSDNLVVLDSPTRSVFIQFDRYVCQEAEAYNSKHHRYIFSIKYRRYYWQISRRFSDIVTLDNRLNRPYRHQHLMANILRPPKFNKFFWSHDDGLLTRRGRSMAAYLQNVVDVPELFEEKIVRIFLELGKTSLYPELGRKGKAGYLKKNYSGRAGDYIKTWRKRWVVLHDTFIAYYKSESDTIPLGYLQVDDRLACYSMARVITIVTKSRQLLLFAPTLREATEWVTAITSFYKLSPRASTQRFTSSFPIRPATNTHIYTCGKDYFAAAAIALLNAREEILIASWMVSANLLMTRPPAPPIRLDQILKFKAEQGVKICVLLYKEIELSGLGNDSMKCKQLLESFGPNVKVMRHPNKLLGGSTAILWSHHEKLLIVDRNLAFVGGIDLCFGRYDDAEHTLNDEEELRFPGLDYYQPASALFRSVRSCSPRSNAESKTSSGSFAAVPMSPTLPIEYMPEPTIVTADNVSDIRSEASDESPRVGPEVDDGVVDIDEDDVVVEDDGLTEEEQAMIREQQSTAQNEVVQPEQPAQSVTQILYSDNIPVATTVESAVALPAAMPEQTKTISPATKDRQRTSTLKDSWRTMLESIGNLSDTVKANFDTMRNEIAAEKVRADDLREGIPRMPWHDIQACVTGVAARDIAAHFVLRWNHHRMAKGMLDIDPLVDVTDDPYFSVCARCNTSKLFECITVCPHCGYNLGPPSSLFIPWSDSLPGAGHVIPIETLTFLQYECTFQSRIGCRIQGDGPVVVTMILDASQCVGEGIVVDSQGEAEYLERLLCMGIKPCIGDIILSVDGVDVTHLSTDQRYFIRRARKLPNIPFDVRFRRHYVENIEEIVAHDKRIEQENFNRNVALFDNVAPDVQVSIVERVSTVTTVTTEDGRRGTTASIGEVTLSTTVSAPKSFAERIRSTLKQTPDVIDPAIERLNLVCAASVSREVGISMHLLLMKAAELAEIPDRRTNSGTCHVQVLRSVGQWSVGHSVESSIRACWIDTINNAQHFVYIENQFFVGNLAGNEVANGVAAALLQRLIRAATSREAFRAIVIIPLHPEGDFVNSSGPRLVMHYEYMTICRGATCFLEQFKRAVPWADPQDYICFCSLRNWGEIDGKIVFEQIYVHDKLLIADDRVVVMGSANINDRSMMGDRDTEVAIRIEDTSHMASRMGGHHWGVGCLPHMLRVRLMATHLGDAYADLSDPISDAVYNQLWLTTARNNTEIYSAFEGDAAMDKCNTLVKYQRANAARPLINGSDPEVRRYLGLIKGHVVMWPMEFLKDTDLSPNVATKVVVPNELWYRRTLYERLTAYTID